MTTPSTRELRGSCQRRVGAFAISVGGSGGRDVQYGARALGRLHLATARSQGAGFVAWCSRSPQNKAMYARVRVRVKYSRKWYQTQHQLKNPRYCTPLMVVTPSARLQRHEEPASDDRTLITDWTPGQSLITCYGVGEPGSMSKRGSPKICMSRSRWLRRLVH